jgi:hypothetical protein
MPASTRATRLTERLHFVGRFRELSFAYDDLWVDDESESAEVRAAALRFKSTQSDS